MADLNIDEFIPTIREILATADLNKITAKDVRRKLQDKFSIDLTPRKREVQELVERVLFEDLDVAEEPVVKDEPEETKLSEQKITKPKKSTGKPKGRPPKAQQKQRQQEQVQQNGNHSDYSSLEDDHPAPKKKRGRKPKSTTKESSDGDNGSRADITNGKKSKANGNTKKKTIKRKRRDDDDEIGDDGLPIKKRKGPTGIHKPLVLSPQLAAFLKEKEMSRLEVVKRLWNYIKENKLQDPKDKRYIICDGPLVKLFEQDRMHSFTMNKYLTRHLHKKEPTNGAVSVAKGAAQKNVSEETVYENGVNGDHDDMAMLFGEDDDNWAQEDVKSETP